MALADHDNEVDRSPVGEVAIESVNPVLVSEEQVGLEDGGGVWEREFLESRLI